MKILLLTAIPLILALNTDAQQHAALTAKNYKQAEQFMSYNTDPLIDHSLVRPNWLPGDKFWYRTLTATGSEFIFADPATGKRMAAFDPQKLAASLSKVTGKSYTAAALPFQYIGYTAEGKAIIFKADGKSWKYDIQSAQVSADSSNTLPVIAGGIGSGRRPRESGNEILSPDGKKSAYIKDFNLWVKDVKSGQQTQLTTDGVKDWGYATDNAGWTSSDRPILLWSPDSKKIATNRQDERNVGDMYLVTTNIGHPTLRAWKYPLPGDKTIATIQHLIINVDEHKVIVLQIAPDAHRSTFSDDISMEDEQWSEDATQLAFISTSRDHKNEKIRIADAITGAVREVFEETVPTQYESGWGSANWKFMPESHEIIWFSERDNWGHLYLYNSATGKLKNQITKGDFVITKLVKVDEKAREIYFMANGREAENPYFGQFCKIGFDGKHLIVLTPEAGNHTITLSPTEKYFIDTYSKPDVPPITLLRGINGKLITVLEKTDVSRLTASGWQAPKPFTVKAHDGKTDLYGLMFTPTHLDPNKKYPVVDYIYPGPQGGSVGNWSFVASRGDDQALAELGFVVVVLEGTSNPLRSKSFHDMSYGNMSENTLPDQITGIKQLAVKFPYMDINRVGIWGHSGGGFATATAMFRYPDFFKVGISESGNHDNRNYEDDWGERYDGLASVVDYDAQANQTYAKNLKGKLMLAHGLMDNNVPPQNTLLVIEALEKANKNYDLVVFPNSAHGYNQYSPYMTRKRWDYFVKYLLGAEPPEEYALYSLRDKPDPRNK